MKTFRVHEKYAFAKAVMADIPKIDYAKAAGETLKELALAAMPPLVRETYAEWPEYVQVRECSLNGEWLKFPHIPEKLDARVQEIFDRYGELIEKQRDARNDLRARLYSLVQPWKTVATARKHLPPELHKYLPAEKAAATARKHLPAAPSILPELTAAGWKP